MKRQIVYIISLFTIFVGILPTYGQVVEENKEVRTFLDGMFQHLEKSKVPYGLLQDYAFELVELNEFDGNEITDANYVDRQIYEFLLRSIRSSAVGAKPFGDVYDILKKQYDLGSANTASLSAMAYRYSFIKANALDDGLIRYENEKVYDNYRNGVWQNPYESKYVIGFCTHDSIFMGSSLTFKLGQDCWFSNLSCKSMEICIDNGTYKSISVGSSVAFSGLSAGLHEVKFRVKLTDGTVLISHSRIRMIAEESAVTRGYISNWVVTGDAYKGIKTDAEVTITSSFDNGKKVMIVVEGFDPRLKKKVEDFFSEKDRGACTYSKFMGKIEDLEGSSHSISNNYNIVYVDWVDSGEYIQANANTLIKVITEINRMKQSAGNNQPNVVLGHSMGGLVARYALKKMENDNLKHNASFYVSCDAPHLGANVPLGALYLLHGVTKFFDEKSNLDRWTGAGTKLEKLLRIAHCRSARQMLVNYVDFAGYLNNTDHLEWQQELAELGFPQGDGTTDFRMLCISNSGYSLSNNIPDTYLKLDFSGSTDILQLWYPIGNLIFGAALGFIFQDFWVGVIETLYWGKSTIKVGIEANPAVTIGKRITNIDLKYIKKFLWLVDIKKTIYSYQRNFNSGLAYDGFPSSKYNILASNVEAEFDKSYLGVIGLDISYEIEKSIPFVPVSSALCVGGGAKPLTSALFTTSPGTSDTPFGANVFMHTFMGEYHHEILSSNSYSWLLAQLELGISGPKLGITGSKYVVLNHEADAVYWTSSNSSIATINSNGILTATGKGVVTLTASVNGHSVSKQIIVGTPRFVLDEVKRDPGYYTIKATCIDTQAGYADFIAGNRDIVAYLWGIKTNDEPLRWIRSDFSELRLNTLEEKDNTTIYLKTVDVYGNESTPLYVRISGYDIWELSNKAFIFNSKGDIYNDNGRKIFYRSSSISLTFKDESQGMYNNAKWSPMAVVLVTDETLKEIPWNRGVSVKDIFLQEDIIRIISSPDNSTWIYKLILLNYERKMIQKSPITVMYKANFPN